MIEAFLSGRPVMRKLLALAIQVPLILSVYGACGGGGDTGDAGDGATDVRAEKPSLDTGVIDSGPTCAPAPVNPSSVVWTPPHAADPTGCSDKQIADYYTACYSSTSSNSTCSAWTGVQANKACQTCMLSVEGSSTEFGALISTGHGVVYANIAGCIALEQNDTSGTGCGAKYWSANQCEDLSCADNCPIVSGDQTTFQAYVQCTQQAAQSECKTYETAQCDLSDAGALLTACAMNGNSKFQDYFLAIGAVFCGGYPADAGAGDAGSDASTDASADADDGSVDAAMDAPDGD
jgi:hypothetical protein